MPETLIAALTELEEEYVKAQADPAFKVRRLMERKTTTTTTHAWNDERGKNFSQPRPNPSLSLSLPPFLLLI